MKIILDAFGGDNAPLEALKGRAQAVKELGVEIIAVGDIAKMEECCKENNIDTTGIIFKHADTVFDMHREPMDIVKKRKDTSMYVGFDTLATGEGDAFVSAGSTGAIIMGATFIVKRIKGCKRPAFGMMLPGANPDGWMLMDCGANNDVRPEMMEQFAVIAKVYMEQVSGRPNPRIALLNNGSEESKGDEDHVQAHKLLAENKSLNFIGNIEGRDVLNDIADIVVADGFSGNVCLKSIEGTAMFMNNEFKAAFKSNPITMLAALLVKKQLKAIKAHMDYSEYGGSPVLGVQKCVIKAHGSSDAKAFKNAIRQAKSYVEKDVSGIITARLNEVKEND